MHYVQNDQHTEKPRSLDKNSLVTYKSGRLLIHE